MRRLATVALALGVSAILWNANPTAALADGSTAVSWDLIAGQDLDVGTVTVDRVGGDLRVLFVVDPGWVLTQVHVYAGLEAPTKSAPGTFRWGGVLPAPATEHEVLIPLDQIDEDATWGTTSVYVAAHAVVEPLAEFYVVSGDGRALVVAYDNVELDPYIAAPVCWCHPHWEEHILPYFVGTGADCIWESEYSRNPGTGEVVDFQDGFALSPGVVVEQAALTISSDNGYEVYLNGAFVGIEGLSTDWRFSDLTEAFVQTVDWEHGPRTYDVTALLHGGLNLMEIGAANEQMDGSPSAETNPAGLIYALWVKALVPGSSETGWADGAIGTPIREGKNWATYVEYVVPAD